MIDAVELMAMKFETDADFDRDLIPHNTARFDVQLSYLQPLIDEGDVDVQQLVGRIREAIIGAVEQSLGPLMECEAIPGGAFVQVVEKSAMLHREHIAFDLS